MVLKALLNKECFFTYRHLLGSVLQGDAASFLKILDDWYALNNESLSIEEFEVLCFPHISPELLGITIQRLKQITSDKPVHIMLEELRKKDLYEQLSVTAYELSTGKGNPDKIQKLIQNLNRKEDNNQIVNLNLTELLNSAVLKPGLRWRLQTLNRMLGSLRPGDFGFIAARPETGKTTMISSEATFMASQLKDSDGPILWFNNEEQGSKVRLRSYQSTLKATLSDLKANPARCEQLFRQKTNNKLILLDNGSFTKYDIEHYCKEHKPSLVIIDQLDKIVGFKADRDDLRLGAIYQWARWLAKEYQVPVIGVSQADVSAEGELWLNMGHVANSKTAKQAEADWIMGIGMKHDPAFSRVRGISIMKNKLLGDPDTESSLRHGRLEVLIQPEVGIYEDIA